MNKMQHIRKGVHHAYSAAADKPLDKHPFPVGAHFAESLGYPRDLLSSIPSVSVDAFAGVSHVSIIADIPAGVNVLDLGCGAGLDSFISSRRVGSSGMVTGIDFSESMLQRARYATTESEINNVEFVCGDAETLPYNDGSFDIALVNGIFNLNPARGAIFHELARVMLPGGKVYAAELILCEPLPLEVRISELEWFA